MGILELQQYPEFYIIFFLSSLNILSAKIPPSSNCAPRISGFLLAGKKEGGSGEGIFARQIEINQNLKSASGFSLKYFRKLFAIRREN